MPGSAEDRSIQRLSRAAFALSLLAPLGGAFALPAVVLAWVAGVRGRKVSTEREMPRPACAGLAIAILSLVFYSLHWAVFNVPVKARGEVLALRCRSNMNQLWKSLAHYAEEHDGCLPTHETWCDALYPSRVPDPGVFVCPKLADDRKRAWFFWIGGLRKLLGAPTLPRCSYAFNSRLSGLALKTLEQPTVVLFESDAGWNAPGGPADVVEGRHANVEQPAPGNGYSFFVFTDGHVEMCRPDEVKALRWEP